MTTLSKETKKYCDFLWSTFSCMSSFSSCWSITFFHSVVHTERRDVEAKIRLKFCNTFIVVVDSFFSHEQQKEKREKKHDLLTSFVKKCCEVFLISLVNFTFLLIIVSHLEITIFAIIIKIYKLWASICQLNENLLFSISSHLSQIFLRQRISFASAFNKHNELDKNIKIV